MEVKVIRSDRKTIALEIGADGLVVRAPRRISNTQIEEFLQKHRRWIEIHTARSAAVSSLPKLTPAELSELAARGRTVFEERAAFYAPQIGVTYGRITVRRQRSRWGSCSANGNLSFNCLLLLAPPEVLDSVVVHELCHRKEMNHSSRFYDEVLRVCPDYRKWYGWLRENGRGLMARLPER